MSDFAKMTTDDMVAYLTKLVSGQHAVVAADHDGPVFPLYEVASSQLPPLTAQIIRSILYSDSRVVDFSVADWAKLEKLLKAVIDDDPVLNQNLVSHKVKVAEGQAPSLDGFTKRLALQNELHNERFSLNPDAPGSMRSWHQNDGRYLPLVACNPEKLSGKAELYHAYVENVKGLQNKQAKKNVKQVYTGYVEYTAGGWREAVGKGRIAYDYVNEKFYLTPTHYSPWKSGVNPWFRVKLQA